MVFSPDVFDTYYWVKNYVGETFGSLLGSGTCSWTPAAVAVFLISPNKKSKNGQFGHGIQVLQLLLQLAFTGYAACSHHEPNVGKFAAPFTILQQWILRVRDSDWFIAMYVHNLRMSTNFGTSVRWILPKLAQHLKSLKVPVCEIW